MSAAEIPIAIRDGVGAEVRIEAGRVVLEEDRRYALWADHGTEAWLGEIPLPPSADGFALHVGRWVGETRLRVCAHGAERCVTVHVIPRTAKLPESLWLALLSDLEGWLPGLTVGAEGGRLGSVGSSGCSAPLLAEALLPLLPAFEQALGMAIAEPRTLSGVVWDEARLTRVRRADRATLAWVNQHPGVAAFLDPWKAAEMHSASADPLVPHYQPSERLDHPANRYLSWLCRRVTCVLRETSAELANLARRSDRDHAWCATRAALTDRAAARIERRWSCSFLEQLRAEPASEAALLVILDDPVYRRVHSIGRRFLSSLFRLEHDREPGSIAAAVRPSFELYELWCFLELSRQLRSLLPDWQWTSQGSPELLKLGGTGSGAGTTGSGASGVLKLEFNPMFRGYLNRGTSKRFSISGERRPDLVLSWLPSAGMPGWICLDAKYRAGSSNLAEAFESVHLYRDALRDEEMGGSCRSAVLLAPARSSDTAAWFSAQFRDKYGAGIFELRPGPDQSEACGMWALEALGVDRG